MNALLHRRAMATIPGRAAAVALAFLAALAASLVVAAPAHAESITRLAVQVTVNADTSMRIIETITYDFGLEYRHGIFRDIPVYDESLTGMRRSYGVELSSVTMDGGAVPWETSDEGRDMRIKIGDPDRTIAFYEALFGWTAEVGGPEYGGYINFTKDGAAVAGAMASDGTNGPANVLSLIHISEPTRPY